MEHIYSHHGKKEDIINASIKLFAEKGYDAVSVRDISKAAGVTEAALYKHFKGKEDMFLTIFKEIIREYCRRIFEIKQSDTGAIEKLCRIVAITFDLYEAHPSEIRFALITQHKFWEVLPNDFKPHLLIKAILEEGMDSGEIPREEVYLLITVYSGLLLEPLAQYPYFYDVLPPLQELKVRIMSKVRKLLQ
ncbi:transcriptional regulator, TetR family [Desulfofarcimen acetoxidans DSM 771]|jgi:AcrR family transcriptional regulator|uniref:Transcriptional regulator, TetR family n=1 Tax=Desulfofarcimen acetoxidans (strain ATCC 49208 / DSM 771 / KCTC 5769 / VKM B-1644 / 5575) TaxID=485916 RepID=C8VXD5_DESAS|nr:TetR/AcrR family transcriptional regulator [Desulfofarcimen acetoxidans]ACV64531.1 transcriptional regulator, TetR family [Desulfofarcimen acetoxidans DSM 771]